MLVAFFISYWLPPGDFKKKVRTAEFQHPGCKSGFLVDGSIQTQDGKRMQGESGAGRSCSGGRNPAGESLQIKPRAHLAPSSSAPGRLRCQDGGSLSLWRERGETGWAGEPRCQAQQGLQLGFSAAPPGSLRPCQGQSCSDRAVPAEQQKKQGHCTAPEAIIGGAPGSLPRLSRKAAPLPPPGRKRQSSETSPD